MLLMALGVQPLLVLETDAPSPPQRTNMLTMSRPKRRVPTSPDADDLTENGTFPFAEETHTASPLRRPTRRGRSGGLVFPAITPEDSPEEGPARATGSTLRTPRQPTPVEAVLDDMLREDDQQRHDPDEDNQEDALDPESIHLEPPVQPKAPRKQRVGQKGQKDGISLTDLKALARSQGMQSSAGARGMLKSRLSTGRDRDLAVQIMKLAIQAAADNKRKRVLERDVAPLLGLLDALKWERARL